MKITFKTFLALGFVFGGAIFVNAQTKEQRAQITKDYDQEKLESLRVQYEKEYIENKTKALELAKVNNWPLKKINKDGSFAELQGLTPEGNPLYYVTSNSGAAITTRVNKINTGGGAGLNLNGQGMIVGVWDEAAARATHQDLVGRIVVMDGTAELSDHGTHVSGTIMGSGAGNPTAKGMAYQATVWSNDWGNDIAESVAEASQGLLVSNHSYGTEAAGTPLWRFGYYDATAQNWDNVMYNAPNYQVVFAAGNDRDSFGSLNATKNGSDLLRGAGTAKNVLTVAAVNQVTNYTGASSVVMSAFSNWGLTDDKRVKPDISAKGVGVVSTVATADDAYASFNGTSMASPNVSGGLILLQQHYNNVKSTFMRSATLRGLVIHTADEAGTTVGPDEKFGWGLMNAERAADVITKSANSTLATGGTKIYENVLSQGQTYTMSVTHDGTSPLTVTMCWTDPAGVPHTTTNVDNTTAKLINDLDVKLVKGSANSYPWGYFINSFSRILPNNVDNVEKVEVQNPAGQYQIVVTHKGTLQGGSQPYSLIISGINSPLTLSNTEFKQESSFVMYPNPASDVLNFDFSAMTNVDDVEISIFDMQGRQVKKVNQALSSADSLSVDISSLLAGSYIVKAKSGDSVASKILIKK